MGHYFLCQLIKNGVNICTCMCLGGTYMYLALINRAGGLYGRILTEVVSTDLTAFGLYT